MRWYEVNELNEGRRRGCRVVVKSAEKEKEWTEGGGGGGGGIWFDWRKRVGKGGSITEKRKGGELKGEWVENKRNWTVKWTCMRVYITIVFNRQLTLRVLRNGYNHRREQWTWACGPPSSLVLFFQQGYFYGVPCAKKVWSKVSPSLSHIEHRLSLLSSSVVISPPNKANAPPLGQTHMSIPSFTTLVRSSVRLRQTGAQNISFFLLSLQEKGLSLFVQDAVCS